MISYDALDELSRIRDRYSNKRTLGYQLVNDCVELAERAIADAQREAEARADGRILEVDRQLERLCEDRDQWRKHYEQVQRALSEKRTIREEREAARRDGDTDVTISNGYVGWTVAGLEEIAYRLRCGGAEDSTPVEVDKSRAKASVPAPNLVTLDFRPAPEPRYEPLAEPVEDDSPPRWLVAVNAVLGSRLMVLACVLFTLAAIVRVVIF